MAYGDFRDLARRKGSDKVLRDKAFNIAKNRKYDGYQRGLASMVYKIFDKKSKGNGVSIGLESSEQLANKLHKPLIRNSKKKQKQKKQKKTVYSGFKDNIWGADLATIW